MFHRRHMPIYLALGWTLLTVLLWAVGVLLAGARDRMNLLVMAIVWGQFIALTGWIAIGSRGGAISYVGSFLWPLVYAYMEAPYTNGLRIFPVIGIALIVAVMYGWMLNLPLFVLRVFSFQFVFDPPGREVRSPAYQVSLRRMMLYTVLVAVVASAWSAAIASPGHGGSESSDFVALIVTAFFIPWSIWACFSCQGPLHGGVTAMLATALGGAIVARLVENSYEVLLFVSIPAALLIAHIALLQAAGFRLRRVVISRPPAGSGE